MQKFFESNVDPTKRLSIDIEAIPTGTERILTIPARDVSLVSVISDWVTGTAYEVGAYVNNANRLYKATVAHTAAAAFATDAANWVEVGPPGGVPTLSNLGI